MSKPRIIILMHYMELGGAEMALLGLLCALDTTKVDVDLFVYSHQGPLMKYIPSGINLLPENKRYALIERPMKETARKCPQIAYARLLAKYDHRKYRKNNPALGDDGSVFQFVANRVERYLPAIQPSVEYDLCISFLTPHNYGVSKVRARRRLAWIHTDYSTLSVNADLELPVWDAYDYIASISPEVTQSFIGIFPSLEHKIIPVENILPAAYVKARADEFDVSSEISRGVILLSIGRYTFQKNFDNIPDIMAELIKLLSVGRFCTAKNYDNVPDITRRIVDSGLKDIKWYIIGYGSDEALIRQRILEAGMEEHVILLGKKENPYPYIKACDIYVQPSRYEGKSVTVREAQMLGKPVVVTAYPTATSQINDGIDGVIVPLDNDGCARGLLEFIHNTELQKKITDYLSSHDFSGLAEIKKIYDLLK